MSYASFYFSNHCLPSFLIFVLMLSGHFLCLTLFSVLSLLLCPPYSAPTLSLFFPQEFLFLLEIVRGDLVWLLCDMLCCRSGLLLEESNCFIPVLLLCSHNASVRHKRVIVNLFWLRKHKRVPCILKKSTKGLTLKWLSQLIFSGYLTFLSPACSYNFSHISFRFVRMAVIRIFVNDLATTKRE